MVTRVGAQPPEGGTGGQRRRWRGCCRADAGRDGFSAGFDGGADVGLDEEGNKWPAHDGYSDQDHGAGCEAGVLELRRHLPRRMLVEIFECICSWGRRGERGYVGAGKHTGGVR